jgi:transposase
MKYALIQVLPDVPPGQVCAGIDWAVADHAACVVDMAGRVKDRFSAAHDKAGIAAMITRLRRGGAGEVAIERGDGVLVDALLGAGLTVVVITSRQVKNLRSRYGAAGAKDDRFDAFVLADTLRTDRARLRPLIPDTPATITLRAAVRARRDLVAHRVAVCNQLRAHLAIAFPAAIRLFCALDSPISLAFLARFGSADAAAQLDEQAIAGWLATIPARGFPAPASVLCGRLRAAPPGAGGTDGTAQAGITAALTATLMALGAQIKTLEAQIGAQLAAHPDAHVFTSLPRSGTLRAARLLAEIGDCRSRFPDPASLAGLAGVAPVTRQSGTHTSRSFRWAVNRQLRDAVCDFAGDSRLASAWAAAFYDAARARGKDHPHATRILARAWIYVIWHCWQAGTAYDPARHNAAQRIVAQQQAAAAADQAAAAGAGDTR